MHARKKKRSWNVGYNGDLLQKETPMSAHPAPQQLFTIEEYLEREEKAEYKSEYYRGEIIAMAGAPIFYERKPSMSAQPAPQQLFTIEEYLEREEKAGYKSEYYKGEIFAMAGGTPPHSAISVNLAIALGNRLRGKCRVYNGDMRVHIPILQYFTYPDVSVVCGKREFFRDNALMNPVLIIEVLSDSTEGYDRGTKFKLYSKITSLQEYVLVAQDTRSVDVFRRNVSGRWELFQSSEKEDVALESVGCTLTMDEIYEDAE
jgi:Uma2 family endonuclease